MTVSSDTEKICLFCRGEVTMIKKLEKMNAPDETVLSPSDYIQNYKVFRTTPFYFLSRGSSTVSTFSFSLASLTATWSVMLELTSSLKNAATIDTAEKLAAAK